MRSKKVSFAAVAQRVCDFVERHKFVLFLLAATIVSIFYGLERCSNADFVCTNGDYQNYNALRRVLDGQIPYHDFANYLGMGPIILCAPLLALHNTFSFSLFVTFFVAAFLFILFIGLIFYLTTKNALISAGAALLIPKLLSSYLLYNLPGFGYYITIKLQLLSRPGNSFRIVRLFLPVLLCIILLLLVRRARHKGATDPSLLRSWAAQPKYALFAGLAVGAGVVWSNDFGFACVGSSFLILLILAIADGVQTHQWGRAFSRFLTFLPGVLLGAFLAICIVTRGHPGSWFSFTRGVADWQFWFFGFRGFDKMYSPLDFGRAGTDLRRTWKHVAIYFVFMALCLYRLCKNKASDMTILFVFLYTSILAGQAVYILGSGCDNFQEGNLCFFLLLTFALWVEAARWLWRLVKKRRKLGDHRLLAHGAVLALLVVYCGYCGLKDVSQLRFNAAQKSDGNYLPALEGVSSDAVALREMQEIVGDATLFSTYATALDDMKDQFQPTGCDYIIHALGDEQFAAYLDNFTSNRYDFVQTTNYVVWPWEPWVAGVAWPFYKELYADYNWHSDHMWWSLWQYAGEDANVLPNTAEVTMETLDEHSVTITVNCDVDEPCYADVVVSWDNAFTNDWQRWISWRHAVFVDDESLEDVRDGIGDGYFQPAVGEERHLLVYVENGQGSITLTGQPAYCTALEVTEAYCDELIRYQR